MCVTGSISIRCRREASRLPCRSSCVRDCACLALPFACQPSPSQQLAVAVVIASAIAHIAKGSTSRVRHLARSSPRSCGIAGRSMSPAAGTDAAHRRRCRRGRRNRRCRARRRAARRQIPTGSRTSSPLLDSCLPSLPCISGSVRSRMPLRKRWGAARYAPSTRTATTFFFALRRDELLLLAVAQFVLRTASLPGRP
jgi:hypothetical protein